LVLQVGIVGLVLWMIMTISICFSARKVLKKLPGSPLFPLAFVIFWYTFLVRIPCSFHGLNTCRNFVMSAYLVLLIGVLYRLPTLKLNAQASGEIAGASIHQVGAD
jgi:hypothetical protein